MAASFNKVIVVGNVTRDIDLRYTSGGNTAVCDIGMAVNDRRKTQSGEWVDETTFLDVAVFGRTAEIASEYLSKGSSVLIEGRLKLDTWETDGRKKSKLKVICEKMQMLDARGGGQRGGGQQAGQQQRRDDYDQRTQHQDHTFDGNYDSYDGGGSIDDDIPF